MDNNKLFAKNVKFLRKKSGKNQMKVATDLGFTQSAWSGYESGNSRPNFSDLMKIIKYFDISASQLLEMDLSNVHLIKNEASQKKQENVHLNVHPNVHLIGQNSPKMEPVTIRVDAENEGRMVPVPITDISVAAGGGHYNQDYIENVEIIRLPVPLIKKNHTYLCVRIKGVSMAPTLQDGGYVIIRLLDKGEWAKMPDERVFVVADMEGKAYLKRVKNRFKQDFIVLRSDSPDQANFPSFNLASNEINSIWLVEWYLSAKLPNIHDQYYTRLQRLEDKVDDILNRDLKIKPQSK